MIAQRLLLASALLLPLLTGCDALGIESTEQTAARQESDGKAIGSACRHAVRAIEDCYTLNPKAQRAAVFAGWREMDEYMRENKIEGVVPVVPRKLAKKSASAEGGEAASEKSEPATAAASGGETHAADESATKGHGGKHAGS